MPFAISFNSRLSTALLYKVYCVRDLQEMQLIPCFVGKAKEGCAVPINPIGTSSQEDAC